MRIHEFGTENEKAVLLVHPSIVMWDYFEYVIPLMEKDYHLLIPALPGYDPDTKDDFTSVEEIASELVRWCRINGIEELACVYGCSMGGSIVLRLLADHGIKIRHAVVDGGITPYELPWLLTRLIAIKDFLMIFMGKVGGLRLLEKAFSTDDYSDEDLRYAAGVLKMISCKTIWRTFLSCNNYELSRPLDLSCNSVEYWFADAEERARRLDIRFLKKYAPNIKFRKIKGVGHGGLAPLQPERLVKGLKRIMK